MNIFIDLTDFDITLFNDEPPKKANLLTVVLRSLKKNKRAIVRLK